MKYVVASNNDINLINTKLKNFNLSKDIVSSLVNNNTCVLFKDNNNLLIGLCLFVISIDNDCVLPKANVIGIYGLNKEISFSIVSYLDSIFNKVYYSKMCIKYLDIKIDNDSIWNEIYLDKSISNNYSIAKNYISRDAISIYNKSKFFNDEISKLEKDRDNWIPEFLIPFIKEIENSVIKYAEGVYSFKLFDKSTVLNILNKAKKFNYCVNDNEDTPYQIPEAILFDNDKKLHEIMLNVFTTVIGEFTDSMYFSKIKEVRSIQLAKYSNSGTIKKGNWHFDEDSDITAVVALNDNYIGGGTRLKMYGSSNEIVIPKLAQGHVLVFRGKHYLHKGLKVENGCRDILVFWSVS